MKAAIYEVKMHAAHGSVYIYIYVRLILVFQMNFFRGIKMKNPERFRGEMFYYAVQVTVTKITPFSAFPVRCNVERDALSSV